jgi:hypothetical protein
VSAASAPKASIRPKINLTVVGVVHVETVEGYFGYAAVVDFNQ